MDLELQTSLRSFFMTDGTDYDQLLNVFIQASRSGVTEEALREVETYYLKRLAAQKIKVVQYNSASEPYRVMQIWTAEPILYSLGLEYRGLTYHCQLKIEPVGHRVGSGGITWSIWLYGDPFIEGPQNVSDIAEMLDVHVETFAYSPKSTKELFANLQAVGFDLSPRSFKRFPVTISVVKTGLTTVTSYLPAPAARLPGLEVAENPKSTIRARLGIYRGGPFIIDWAPDILRTVGQVATQFVVLASESTRRWDQY